MDKKEILQKLRNIFSDSTEETKLAEVEVTEEVSVSEVELADEPAKETPLEPAPVQTVEYATKVELEEMKKKFMDLFEAMQRESETKKEVPQELSKEDEVELSSDIEEVVHSPEVEVEKKLNFSAPKSSNQSLESKIYNKLFNK